MKNFTLVLCTVSSFCSVVSFFSRYKGVLKEIIDDESITTSTKVAEDSSLAQNSSIFKSRLISPDWQIEQVINDML